jgi:hypothetical protein
VRREQPRRNFLDELVARTGCALLLWAFCSIDRRKRSPSVHFSRWAQRAERSLVGRRITTKQAYSSSAELRKVVIRMQVTPTPPLIWFHLPEHWIRWTVVSTANRSVGHERRSSTRCAGGGTRYGRRCGQRRPWHGKRRVSLAMATISLSSQANVALGAVPAPCCPVATLARKSRMRSQLQFAAGVVHVPGPVISNRSPQSSTKSPCRFDLRVERMNRIAIAL